jgi:hypothetical protein
VRTLIESYRNFPGEHCGSVAMRGLLHHYCGLDLPEPAVFGLGSGAACLYIASPRMDPCRMVSGRGGTLEVDVASALGVDYRERRESDDALAWQQVREEVLAGRPTMLSGDILYLDYREYKVHFPGHRFVLLGFDDDSQKAYIADRINEAPELCSYGALAKSRNPPEGLSTENLWGRFHGTHVEHDLEQATRIALERCARGMLGEEREGMAFGADAEDTSVRIGVDAIRAMAEDLPRWRELPDPGWVAGYNARVIEKFGNGGGNFRRLYAGFLAWAHEQGLGGVPQDAALRATLAADGWTGLSATLFAASEEGADPALFDRAGQQAAAIAEIEEQLFQDLLRR